MPLTLDGTAGLFGNVTGGNISGNFTGGNASAINVTSTGSTTARSLANRFADVVNVLDFGAHSITEAGYENFDSTSAIQAAIDYANTKNSKIIFVPAGTYILTNTITFPDGSINNGCGIKLYGDGNNGWGSIFNGTRFLVTHTNGPAFKLQFSGQSIESCVILSGGARSSSTAYNSNNWGILIEPPDDPSKTAASVSFKNLTVTGQPSSGIVASGNVFQCYFEQVACVNNKGHGLVIDCGAITGRTNRSGQIGGFVLVQFRTFGNLGNSIVAGLGYNPASNISTPISTLLTNTTLGAYRISLIDADLDFTAGTVQHLSDNTLYGFKAGYNSVLFGDNFTFQNVAFGGQQASSLLKALYIQGRNIAFINNRFIRCGKIADIKAMNSENFKNTGFRFVNPFIYNDTPATDMPLAIEGINTGSNRIDDISWDGDTPSTVQLFSGSTLTTINEPAKTFGNKIYIPTLFNTQNVTTSTAYELQYFRIGDRVTVSGRFDVIATSASGTQTILGMSLPISSNFNALTQLGGSGSYVSGAATNSTFCRIAADSSNDRALIDFNSNTTNTQTFGFSFNYRII